MTAFTTEILEHQLVLLADKAAYYKPKKALLIADLHFGKVTHFRKSGLAVPAAAINKNWQRFTDVVLNSNAKDVYLLGDLFHSQINTEWIEFKEIITNLPDYQFHLVVGNHDIFDKQYYLDIGVIVHEESLLLDQLLLTHEPLEIKDIPDDQLNICGHIHPGTLLRGMGRQTMRLPCFHYDNRQLILPAFGEFTGLYVLEKKKTSRIFVVAEEQVIEV